MVRKKKPFIDKKNATTYKLVHRSQHDPLIADEDANQLVLQEIPGVSEGVQEDAARLAEQKKVGIYFEDEYDYMQHVKDRSTEQGVFWEAANPTRAGKVELPVCVLPSATEEPIGMLNLAAPRGLDLSLDPDIVAALDDDFDFEDPDLELEDDFIGIAEGAVLEEYGENEEEYYGSGEEDDDVDSMFSGRSDDGEMEQCRFTEYSVSSSVLPRSDGLTLLDDRFEEIYKEYDEVGAGEEELKPVDELHDHEQEPGLVLEHLCQEFERETLSDEETMAHNKARTLELNTLHLEQPEKRELVTQDVDQAAGIPWDCETILSTYSNIYNHPKLIEIPKKIKLNRKGIVVDDIKEEKEDDDEGVDSSGEENTTIISNYRTKSESAEEKRLRKKAVKESQRARRQVKKATKEVFKEENSKESKMNIMNQGKVVRL